MTPHSTAFLSSTLSTVKTLLTVFAAFDRNTQRRCTSSSARCHIFVSDAVESGAPPSTADCERKESSPLKRPARLLAIGHNVVLQNSRRKLRDCRHLLVSWSTVRTVLQQMPLTILPPAHRAGLRAHGRFAPLSMPVVIRQPEVDVHFPPPFRNGLIVTLIVFSPVTTACSCGRASLNKSRVRIRTRRPMRITPGNCPPLRHEYTALRRSEEFGDFGRRQQQREGGAAGHRATSRAANASAMISLARCSTPRGIGYRPP